MRREGIFLILLNLITICSVAFMGGYVAWQIFHHDAPAAHNKNMPVYAAVAVATVTLTLVTAFTEVTAKLAKRILKKRLQLFAAASFVFLICLTDAILHGHFNELEPAAKYSVVFLNVLAVLEMVGSVVTTAIWDKQPS